MNRTTNISISLLAAVLALGCGKGDSKSAAPTSGGEPKPVAAQAEGAKPSGKYKGVAPKPMPAMPALDATNQEAAKAAADAAQSGMVQYGVQRGSFPDPHAGAIRANPTLLIAIAGSPRREAQVAAAQAMLDYQVSGDPKITLTPEHRAALFALMTSTDTAVAASATQSASGGWHDDKADPEIRKLLIEQCANEPRVSVRAAACSGIVAQLNTKFGTDQEGMAAASAALEDEDPYVVMRTLEIMNAMTLSAKYVDKVLSLTKHTDAAIRGLAAGMLDRALYDGGNQNAEATRKAHDALSALLKDPEGYVRCKAALGLSGWNQRTAWDVVDPLLALAEDAAPTKIAFKHKAEWFEGQKDAEWTLRGGSNATVKECAIRALVSRATNASAEPLKFDNWAKVADEGLPAFKTWWAANGAKLANAAASP